MGEEKAKRRFWRIHLLTAVVMMFVAAGVLFLNVRTEHVVFGVNEYDEEVVLDVSSLRHEHFIFTDVRGFPYRFNYHQDALGSMIRFRYLAADCAIALVVIGAFGAVTELIMRVRE